MHIIKKKSFLIMITFTVTIVLCLMYFLYIVCHCLYDILNKIIWKPTFRLLLGYTYKFDLEVKGQRRIRILNVLDTSYHGERPMCQLWFVIVKTNRSYRSDMNTWQKPIKFDLEVTRSTSNRSHLLMVIGHCAKYGKPMSNKKL